MNEITINHTNNDNNQSSSGDQRKNYLVAHFPMFFDQFRSHTGKGRQQVDTQEYD